ncbi:serine hydrolase domain-containing protein [Nocardia jiangxiensis]|uniref:Serine hydrolase domain-containing protein n=1 Tax=Nocardia jiangxiensis TaxID=282685 RepID=A0ABW6RXA7_9NOCA|nr:serine hydrolase domain-containing protein [Nocardia jiangxiensis]
MGMRALALSICALAALLPACTMHSAGPVAVPSDALARLERVHGDLDAIVRSGAVGAIATLSENGASTVVTAGRADIATGAAIPTDRPEHVRIGSITKTFTAAIVLQLAAEHRLDLDQPIETYLPGLLTGDGVDGHVITVREILGHRSGLPQPADSPETNDYEAARLGRTFTPAQLIAFALRYPAQFAPGARFEYANTNYIVAGMLIEAVTGHRYTDELRDRILTRLDLPGTYLPATGETGLRNPHPTGYGTVDGIVTDQTRIEPSLSWSAGALVSTGADLNRFFTAVLAGRVVPRPQLRQMLDGTDMGHGDGMSYGLGIAYTQLPCGAKYVGHLGDIRGFSAISGATAAGRAVTVSYTGTPAAVDVRSVLTHALCG